MPVFVDLFPHFIDLLPLFSEKKPIFASVNVSVAKNAMRC